MGADESKNFQARREELKKRDAEGIKKGEVYQMKWFSVKHGEEVHEKVQRYLWYFLWN